MVDRLGKNFSIILTNHGHFGLFSTLLKFERGRPRWILSDSRSTWKIQIVSKRMQNASNMSMWGGGKPVHRKASRYSMCQYINLTSVPSVGQSTGSSYSTTDRMDSLVEERDQKVSVGLGGVPPWAFRHRSLLKTRLGSSPMAQLPVLPYRTF